MGDDAAEASSGGHRVGPKMPFEISGAVAEAEQLGDTRSQVAGQHPGLDDDPLSLGPEGQPASPRLTDLGRFVLAGARSRLLTEIVDSLVQGTRFIALTGVPGVGKTLMAVAIREELNKRSMSVRWVDGGEGGSIRLQKIMSKVLGKPEADIDDNDIEQLFDAMTEREGPLQRLVLIIDDAERLLPHAIGYLRLLASVAMERMPQILFVGDTSFWDTAGQAAQAGFADLIAARFELEPLSPREASAAAQRLMSALSPAHRPVFERDALEMVRQRADGLISRLVPLVAAIETIAVETDLTRVTTAMVEEAAARLVAQTDPTNSEFVYTPPPEDICAEAIGTTGALAPIPITPRPGWSVAQISGVAAALVGTLGLAIYWLATFSIDPILAEPQSAFLEGPEAGGSVSPDTTITVRLPDDTTAVGRLTDAGWSVSPDTPMVVRLTDAGGTISPDTTMIVRLPVSVPTPHAVLSTSDYDGLITTQVILALVVPQGARAPTFSVPQSETSIATDRPALRKHIGELRPAARIQVSPPSNGVWLFPPNPNTNG